MLNKMNRMDEKIKQAVDIITKSKHAIVYTGAGISVESGIPPFRGDDGLWNKYDPKYLDLDYFFNNPYKSWIVIKEIFYNFFGNASPNAAHIGLAEMEKMGLVKAIVTQNIDKDRKSTRLNSSHSGES